jgi:hypothetical protein
VTNPHLKTLPKILSKPHQIKHGSMAFMVQSTTFANNSSSKYLSLPNPLYSPLLELMSKKNAPPRFFSSLSQLESDSNMMNRDFSKLDRKKLQYEDIIKVKWKTIQYVVDNKKPQMDMLTRNMRELINEVKQETRNM